MRLAIMVLLSSMCASMNAAAKEKAEETKPITLPTGRSPAQVGPNICAMLKTYGS